MSVTLREIQGQLQVQGSLVLKDSFCTMSPAPLRMLHRFCRTQGTAARMHCLRPVDRVHLRSQQSAQCSQPHSSTRPVRVRQLRAPDTTLLAQQRLERLDKAPCRVVLLPATLPQTLLIAVQRHKVQSMQSM